MLLQQKLYVVDERHTAHRRLTVTAEHYVVGETDSVYDNVLKGDNGCQTKIALVKIPVSGYISQFKDLRSKWFALCCPRRGEMNLRREYFSSDNDRDR